MLTEWRDARRVRVCVCARARARVRVITCDLSDSNISVIECRDCKDAE